MNGPSVPGLLPIRAYTEKFAGSDMGGSDHRRFLDRVAALAAQIEAAAAESEAARQLAAPVAEAMKQAGLFRLWIPRAYGGEESDPEAFVQVIEAVSRIDGSAGWCVMIGGCYGLFAGLLPAVAARTIYGSDPLIVSGGAFRPTGQAVVVDGGYRVTGRWQLGSGCHHCGWLVGGCRVFDGDQPRLKPDGSPVVRLLFFPAAEAEILDTWFTAGLRGTGSHDYVVSDAFVPATHSLWFQDMPVESGPLYALPVIALFAIAIAAVPLGIARHAIDILAGLSGAHTAVRTRQPLNQQSGLRADFGRAEALLRSGRALLYQTLAEAWQVVTTGETLDLKQRAMLWLAATHAARSATEAVDLMFTAGGSASIYADSRLERCLRDVRTAGQHICIAPGNFEMAGQALLGFDTGGTPLALDDRRAL